jgi:S-adenosylmethionine hydrolase
MTKPPLITLLTDFGLRDHYVAAMKGSVLSICPDASLVDVTHEITPYSITEAAYTLSQTWSCFPAGTIHIVVVDPGVGSARRPLLIEAGGHFFIGPDNGVFGMVLAGRTDWTARQITDARYFRPEVSQTFHGRDLFAPVAAHLATGVMSSQFGDTCQDLVPLENANPVQTGPHTWQGTVLTVDRFGNIITSFSWNDFANIAARRFEMRAGELIACRYYPHYDEAGPGEPFLLRGSGDYVEVSLNQGDAARAAQVRTGSPVKFRWI